MKTEILDAQKNKKIIGIYSDYTNPNSFSVGYLLYVDDKHIYYMKFHHMVNLMGIHVN